MFQLCSCKPDTVTPVAKTGLRHKPFSFYKSPPFIPFSPTFKRSTTTATHYNPSSISLRIQAMIPAELTGNYFLVPESEIPVPANFGMMQSNIPAFDFNNFLSNYPYSQIPANTQEFTPQSSSISNNSTSDEAEERQMRIIDERKQRRMISNRESARRSRMRKQRHLDELWSQLIRLRNENHNLIDKLNHVSECHDRVLQENAQLKEEASDLRQMLTDLKIGSPSLLL